MQTREASYFSGGILEEAYASIQGNTNRSISLLGERDFGLTHCQMEFLQINYSLFASFTGLA